MASLGPKGGQAAHGRRTRSASLSSESSGGGAPLHADFSDLTVNDNTHHRSISEIDPSRIAKMAHTVTSSNDVVENIGDGIRQQNFQIGKPPHGDEEVFSTDASMSQHILAGPAPIIDQETTSGSQSVVPIHTQPSPAERRHLVQGVDAQTYYPAEACIFVANLPESKSDTVLEVAVTKVFSAFGPVFVKIRRDPKNMPFAFCQYTDSKHAHKAQMEGKGLLVEGRPCRTEMVKANRCYVMFNREGHQVNVVEARSHLLQFGEISKLEPLHEEAVNAMKLPGAVFVQYTHFDPGRDIISAYRYHEEYGVVAYDLKKVNPSQSNHYANYLARYEVDRRSIYVGNLPHNVENIEEVLRHAASKAGTVERVQVIRKDPRNEGGRPTVFAFVEYARPDEALVAVDNLRGTILVNNRIRVEKKKCADHGGHFRGADHFSSHRGEASVSTFADTTDSSNETIPATPARSIAVGADALASGGGTDVNHATSQSISPNPDYRPVVFSQRRAYATPTTYQHGRTFTSPNQGYQPGTFASPGGYGQAQYASPNQAYQPTQYMSPNYALSPGDQHRNQYGQGSYQPATPYHGGNGGPYYQGQSPNPFWATPYLQDQNNGYQYYAGYGQQHRTPMGAPARSVNAINAGQTPTRNVDLPAQQHNLESGEQADEDAGENTSEKK